MLNSTQFHWRIHFFYRRLLDNKIIYYCYYITVITVRSNILLYPGVRDDYTMYVYLLYT